jgi:hypothetical protein
VGCGEVRRGRGTLYRGRSVGRRSVSAAVVVAEWRHHSGCFALE